MPASPAPLLLTRAESDILALIYKYRNDRGVRCAGAARCHVHARQWRIRTICRRWSTRSSKASCRPPSSSRSATTSMRSSPPRCGGACACDSHAAAVTAAQEAGAAAAQARHEGAGQPDAGGPGRRSGGVAVVRSPCHSMRLQYAAMDWGPPVAQLLRIERTPNTIWKLQALLSAVQALHNSFAALNARRASRTSICSLIHSLDPATRSAPTTSCPSSSSSSRRPSAAAASRARSAAAEAGVR